MKNVIRLYKIMLTHWFFLILGLIFMLGYSFFNMLSLTLIKPILDYIFVKRTESVISINNYKDFWQNVKNMITSSKINFSSIFNFKEYLESLKEPFSHIMLKTNPYTLLYLVMVLALFAFILKNIFYYGDNVSFEKLKNSTIYDIRNKIFDKYMHQSLAFFKKNKVGDSMVRMIGDVDIISRQYIVSLMEILRNLIIIVLLVYLAVSVNKILFLKGIIIFPLFPVVITLIGKKIKKYAQRIQGKFSDLFNHVQEVLTNMHIVKAFAKEEVEDDKFKEVNKQYLKFSMKTVYYSTLNTPISEMNSILTILIIIFVGGREVLLKSSAFSFGDFSIFVAAVASILHPVKQIAKNYAELKKAGVSLQRVFSILELKTDMPEKINALEKKTFDKEIELKNVNFSYEDKVVLKDINLKIEKRQKVALVGRSGSGKTTLVNLLQRMYDIEDGEILIDKIPIKDIKLKEYRKLFGMVTQNSILFSTTIAENIAYGSTENKVEEKQIIEAAIIAYADDFIEQLKNKYKYFLYSQGANLSGGQKQRICIARAIVGNPPIIIFDEATSALDTIAEQKVQKAIECATANRTVIMIAHRLSTILSSDKIIFLKEGKIIGEGKHEELLKKCAEYKKLYDLQFNN